MSTPRCEVSEAARQDLAAQYEWYAGKAGTDIAERYLASFRHTVDLLTSQPEAGALRKFRSPRLRDIRSLQVAAPFRAHLVFYRMEGDHLVVFRVLHGMRDLSRRLSEPPD
jgi:toxin ParE1/3/4